MDQGLIALCKKKYRSCYLQRAVDTLLEFRNGRQYVESRESGRLGISDGRLPHVADAMSMLDMAWDTVARSTVIRCWIKSNCASDTHREELDSLLGDTSDPEVQDVAPEITAAVATCTQLD